MSYSPSCQELAFSEIHIQHPASLRPYETGGWPIAPTSAAGGPQDLGDWIVMRLGAISKIQNALSYASAPFWMVAKERYASNE